MSCAIALLPILLGQVFGRPAPPYLPAEWYPTVTWSAPPRPPGTVYVYRAGAPRRPAREVGWIHVEAFDGYANAVQKLLAAAASHGCDAIGNIQSHFFYQGVEAGITIPYPEPGVELEGSCYAFEKGKPAPDGKSKDDW